MFGLFNKPRPRDDHPAVRDLPDTLGTRVVEDTIALATEEVVVDTRQVEGDTVRVDVVTETQLETVSAELLRDAVDVRRVPMDTPVDSLPATRTEGDTTIVPVMRERLVLKRELVLVEEIHITHRRERSTVEREVELRRQVPQVTRTPAIRDAAE